MFCVFTPIFLKQEGGARIRTYSHARADVDCAPRPVSVIPARRKKKKKLELRFRAAARAERDSVTFRRGGRGGTKRKKGEAPEGGGRERESHGTGVRTGSAPDAFPSPNHDRASFPRTVNEREVSGA